MIWQLRNQKGTEHLNQVYMLASTAFRANVRGAKYREASDPETEIWRACQRFGARTRGPTLQWMGVKDRFLLLSPYR
jgi:ribulose bisphosphate carboxylase small subunit